MATTGSSFASRAMSSPLAWQVTATTDAVTVVLSAVQRSI